MNKPTLTIVTVVYNGEMYIEDTIKVSYHKTAMMTLNIL